MKSFDVIIIGGGIVGCLTARYLSRYDLKILLLEKDSDIGMGPSAANSACIHAGHDPVPGTLKARMNHIANPLWPQLAAELSVPFKRSGAYVVALQGDEPDCLEILKQQGDANGVSCQIISAQEMQAVEPRINPLVMGALRLPTAGAIDPFIANVAAAENALQNGVELLLDTAFESFILDGRKVVGVHTNRGDFGCRWVINSAGLYADEVMHSLNIHPEFKITGRRGEYLLLDETDFQIDCTLFPVPSAGSKGILVMGSLHGNTVVGPNAQFLDDKENSDVTPGGLVETWLGAQKLIPGLNLRSVIATFAGVRASGNAPCLTPGVKYGHDFIIETAREVDGLINLAGIESPGYTSAPAIALEVIGLLQQAGELLVEKRNWNPFRPARPVFRHLSHAQQAELCARDPSYGRIICRCEMVTEGEILAELRSPIPARTYDALKRRTWLGTGRCQGAFDMPRVVDLLARQWNISPLDVTKKGKSSEFLVRRTKQVEG
jgi:glycerol-3-phosphate dehydrogenase